MTESTGALLPWQALTADAGLTLAGPVDLRVDAAMLEAELAAVERQTPMERRVHVPAFDGWCSIPLIVCPPDQGGPGRPCPALDHMPGLRAVLEHARLRVADAHLTRIPGGGRLDWHRDPLGGHCAQARLILPIRTNGRATTWISHEPHRWPAGACWTADFTLPHMVENPAEADRIVLTLDVLIDDAFRPLLPPGLLRDARRREGLAQDAVNLMLRFQAAQAAA